MGARARRGGMNWLKLHAIRETPFFSTVDGELRQWIELDVASRVERAVLDVEVRSGGTTASRAITIGPVTPEQRLTLRCYAPLRWPRGADRAARLTIVAGGGRLERRITVGTHRPWTVHLLSDLCADDTWAYASLEAHDRDDYLTTRSELDAGADNRYNLATTYQAARFLARGSAAERKRFVKALRRGRIYATPVPSQMLCGALVLGAYPLALEPYRDLCRRAGAAPLSRDAYHMEATSWAAGLANLLSCAGFRSFGKSLLRYQAPWLDTLERLPRLTRHEVAPGRWMWLLLRCGDYTEGRAIRRGLSECNAFLHERAIPGHESLGDAYPASVLPLVGAYGDLAPSSPDLVRVKMATLEQYNGQEWEYPKLVNSTWPAFFDALEGEIGTADRPTRRGVVVSRGDTGSSWEVWMMAAAREAAQYRSAQRRAVSLRTLSAMSPAGRAVEGRLNEAALELAYLTDHAWNGSSRESKKVNLAVRRRRLSAVGRLLGAGAKSLGATPALRDGARVVVMNTLCWSRPCRVDVPARFGSGGWGFVDPGTDESFPIAAYDGRARAFVPDVPGFGGRMLLVRKGIGGAASADMDSPVRVDRMAPRLNVAGKEVPVRGRWNGGGRDGARGSWKAGPFSVEAHVISLATEPGAELVVDVKGRPPVEPYELRWAFDLPWSRATWRGETGGGFHTPGPVEAGGDSLLGIAGSIFSSGEGLSAASTKGGQLIDFAFDESGMCGLGGRTTSIARGTYGERPGARAIRSASMKSTETPGVLEWFLLSTGQNPSEALVDQGGTRRWSARCAMRRRRGRFDDAELYRFAAGFNLPAELVLPRSVKGALDSWLSLRPPGPLLVLGAARRDGRVEIDFYNTSARSARTTLSGRAVARGRLTLCDMLGREELTLEGRTLRIGPRAYARLLVSV